MIELKASLQKALPLNYNIDPGQPEPLVSVILPVYNGERYIADSVRSVLAQTYRNLELIIINDGSTDRTLEILEEFRNDQRVKIHTQPNRKLPAALSAGFAKANGEFYTWTSADNLMKPRCLEVLVKFLSARSDVEMVYANEEIIDDQGKAVEESDFCPGYQVPPGSANIHWPQDPGELIFVQNNYIGACFLYRSWAGRILGDYDAHCFGYEDYEYWMRMDALFRVAHLGRPDTLYLYRLHEESLSAKEKQMKIVERVRSFMSIEGERHQLYADLCDVTLIGSHPWFSSFEGLYRSAGHNVFAWKDHNPSNSYHFQITRSSEKAVAIIAVDELIRQRSLSTFLKELSAAQPDCLLVGIVDHVATLRDNLFPGAELDWVLSGTPAVVSDLQAQGMRNYLEVRAAEAVAYPLMCVVNNAFGLRLAHARLEQNDQPVLETTLRATT
jgi:glycosyltransferase involved in cell wall biosynthesis